MEIYRIGTALFVDGKGKEARIALTKLVQYMNEKYAKYGRWELWASMDGDESAHHWVERLKSYAAFEEYQAAWAADPRNKDHASDCTSLDTCVASLG